MQNLPEDVSAEAISTIYSDVKDEARSELTYRNKLNNAMIFVECVIYVHPKFV